jgi:adenylate kinase family enzyme
MGNTGAGKSTLAARLARILDAPQVELDALYWQPGWTPPETAAFHAKLGEATRGEAWVVAGSFIQHCERVFWDRLETVIYLDVPLPALVARVVRRSWRRARDRELLWGTNVERFWPHLRVWRPEESLIGWAATQQTPKRRDLVRRMADPRWSHVRFVRLCGAAEVDAFVADLERALAD